MEEKHVIYTYMNKNFEFVDENGNIVYDLSEAAGYADLEIARKERANFDDPEEWKIVKKIITFRLDEIIDD